MKNIFTLNTSQWLKLGKKLGHIDENGRMKQAQDTANLNKTAGGDLRQALVDLFDKGYLQEDPSTNPSNAYSEVSYRLTYQAGGILRTELSKRDNPESSGENEKDDAGFGEAMRGMLPPQGA